MKQKRREKFEEWRDQPPSGGCVLKLLILTMPTPIIVQPPSGGCVLKLLLSCRLFEKLTQPPSGGCVLKQKRREKFEEWRDPAAFRRLCVET